MRTDVGGSRTGSRSLFWFGLVVLWLGFLLVYVVSVMGDCGGPEEVCIEASARQREAFYVALALVVSASGAAILAVISTWRIWLVLFAGLSATGLLVSVASFQGIEAPPLIAPVAIYLAPGFAFLLLAAGFEVWDRRASGGESA